MVIKAILLQGLIGTKHSLYNPLRYIKGIIMQHLEEPSKFTIFVIKIGYENNRYCKKQVD